MTPLLHRFGHSPAMVLPAVVLSILAGASAVAAGSFDGTYSGSTKISGSANSACAADGSRVQMTVIDGKVSYNHFSTILTGTVEPDGSFTASGRNMRYKPPVVQSISGHISSNGAEADSATAACNYHITFRKL